MKSFARLIFICLCIGAAGCSADASYSMSEAATATQATTETQPAPETQPITETQPAPETQPITETQPAAETQPTAETHPFSETQITTAAPTTAELLPASEMTTSYFPDTAADTTMPAESETTAEAYSIFSKQVVNIRISPSTKSTVIGQTRKNAELTCIGKTGKWYIVRYADTTAYVYASYFSKTPTGSTNESVDDPYTYYDMVEDITKLENTYTDFLNVDILGRSFDDRNLYLITLGNPEAPKSVLFTASIHGAEYISSQLVMAQAEYYLSNMTEKYNGKTIREILNNVCIYIMPMVNPDGVSISQYGFSVINNDELRADLLKLEYTDKWCANARGIDINRNFPTVGFSVPNSKTEKNAGPSFKYYGGESANSEIETQTIIEFVNSHPTLTAYVSYHTKGEVIYWNKGQTGTLYTNTKKLARLIARLTKYQNVTYLQNRSGIDYEWAILEAGIAGCTVEIGDIESYFPVRQTQWPDIWKRNQNVMIAVADLFSDLK